MEHDTNMKDIEGTTRITRWTIFFFFSDCSHLHFRSNHPVNAGSGPSRSSLLRLPVSPEGPVCHAGPGVHGSTQGATLWLIYGARLRQGL